MGHTPIVLIGLFTSLLTLVRPADSTAIRVCVDCPVGAPNFPITAGHAFVQMIPMAGPQVGNQNLVYGFYPAGNNPFGAGKVRNDSKRPWDFCITYNVTPAQYNAAAGTINADIAAPPGYNLFSNNCVDWVNKVTAAAGIALPNTKNRAGIDDPNALWSSLNSIGVGGTSGGGTVTNNPNRVSVGGTPLESASPRNFSFEGVEYSGHTDPFDLASFMDLPSNVDTLDSHTVKTSDAYNITVEGVDPANVLISVDWGDGTVYDAQMVEFSHIYEVPESYMVSLLIIDQASVYRFLIPIQIADDVSTQSRTIGVETLPAATGINPNFGDDPIQLIDEPEDGTIVAPASWGEMKQLRR